MMMMKKKQSNKDCYKQVFFIMNIFENLIQTFMKVNNAEWQQSQILALAFKIKVLLSQVHSITARSVSRQFRESLKAGKSEIVDTIFKLPEAKQNIRVQDMLPSSPEHKVVFVTFK